MTIMSCGADDFEIPDDKIRQAKTVFSKYDKRGLNKMSTTDLGPAFYALNLQMRDDVLKEWADLVDEEATGYIDEAGFLALFEKKLRDDADEKDLRDAFRSLDKNKRGEIDVADLRWILSSLGDDLSPEEIEEMIQNTDTDGSGFVDFDEFYKLMTG